MAVLKQSFRTFCGDSATHNPTSPQTSTPLNVEVARATAFPVDLVPGRGRNKRDFLGRMGIVMTFPLRAAVLSAGAAFMLAACGSSEDATETAPPTPDAPALDAPPVGAQTPIATDPGATPPELIPNIRYHTLENGLRIVLAPEASVPTATLAVYYDIGFRVEPRGRTGFAHLFEHMMFEGSANLPKGSFDDLILGNGGVLNGSTRFDFTNYYEVAPSHQLERLIWAEADRMRGLEITQQNLIQQQGVVTSEVKVNVLNQPYGGFPWLDMPQIANENWYNAHNFYGDLADIQAATLEDVQDFFDTYYTPNNAVVAIAGDFDPDEALSWARKYFGDIPAGEAPPLADVSEPRQEAEKFAEKDDPLAPRPALAFAYHVPPRNTPEWLAMGLIDLALLQGDDSRLYDKLVREKGYTDSIDGGVNLLGNLFNYNGPMLWMGALIHDADTSHETILSDLDEVIAELQSEPMSEAEFERAKVKFRSQLYDIVASPTRFGLVDLLAVFALFDDDPTRINTLELGFEQITPELIQRTAQDYLRPSNRTVLVVNPGAAPETEPSEADPNTGSADTE